MLELENFSWEKDNDNCLKGSEQCRMCIYTPEKLLLNLDFLNSPNQDNEVLVSDYYKDNQFNNNAVIQTSITSVFDFEENVFQLQQPEEKSENELKTIVRTEKSLIKTAKPFIPKSKILRTAPINDENDSQCLNLRDKCSLNSKWTSMNKFTCRLDIQIPNEPGFKVAKRIIGYKGNNMKKVIDMWNTYSPGTKNLIKLRLRGKGSGFIEKPENKESEEDLHLCVSSKFLEFGNQEIASLLPFHRHRIFMAYEVFTFACRSIESLLTSVYKDYKKYMIQQHGVEVNLSIKKYFNNPAVLVSQFETDGLPFY